MLRNEIIGGSAVLLSLCSGSYYMWQIFTRAIKPHVFSWIVWGTLGLIIFAAQYVGKAGPGCWVMGFSSVLCYVVAAASYSYGEKDITRSDWFFFISGLLAIPLWIATSNPLWAVILASLIDSSAFYPTFRKAWSKPHEEGALVFCLYSVQMLLSLLALDNVTLTTALNPAIILILNATLTLMLFYRRRVLA